MTEIADESFHFKFKQSMYIEYNFLDDSTPFLNICSERLPTRENSL